MTPALVALWSCFAGGDASYFEALRAEAHRSAVHRHHLRALKARTTVEQLLHLRPIITLGPLGAVTAPIVMRTRGLGEVLAAATSTPTVTTTEKSASTAVAPERQLCSLNVSDYEIQKFLPLLTHQTGLNIILMTTSPVKVTMHVEKMPLIDVMRHVCALTGFAFVKAGEAYVLAPADTLKHAYAEEWKAAHPSEQDEAAKATAPIIPPEPQVTRTFVANYIKAAQLVDTIKKLVPKDLEVVAGPGQDTPTLSNIDPSQKTGQSSVSVVQEVSTGPLSRTVILRGPKAAVDSGLEIARQLDIPRSQVSIGVTIHDISDDAVKDLGLSWNFSNLTLTESPAANGISVGKVTRSPMTFDAAIKALETRDVARLMASPNVSLLDGEKAFILIGDRINYPVLTGYTSTNSPIFSVNTERVGIYLQVAASIASDGFITLTLYPQVSSITGYLNVNGASYPQVSSREAQTTLRVKSGDMIVLGGLMQDQDIQNIDKVPILSSLPFVGELFKHRTKTKSKSQVIITIKPAIVPPPPQ